MSGITLSAINATAVVSLVPNLLLLLIPASILKQSHILPTNSINYQNLFLAFASGGLLGDVFLHVIPHLISEHRSSSDESQEEHHYHGETIAIIGGFIVIGYLIFFITERISSAKMGKDKSDDCSHGHTLSEKLKMSKEQSVYTRISTSGWLNLLADSMHNFTDGIALGSSFASGKTSIGISTFLSVLFHEVPHEIGDFSILLESGLTKFEAIQAQFLTAIAAFAGTFVGLYFQTNDLMEDTLLAITSGGFIYIAASNMLPKLLQSKQSSAKQICLEIIVFILGLGFMAFVLLLENDEHHSH